MYIKFCCLHCFSHPLQVNIVCFRINPLSLVEIILAIIREYSGKHIKVLEYVTIATKGILSHKI